MAAAGANGVRDDGFGGGVVEVADGRPLRPDATLQFLADATVDVFGKN